MGDASMPRLVQKLPQYRRHAASGNAVVTLSGIDHYLGKHGSKASRVLYDRLLAEWLVNGRATAATNDAAPLTIVELSARYWRFAVGYYRKDGRCTGVAPAIKATLRYLKEWYGRERVTEFGPLRLKALRERMVADGHSRRYVNDHVDRIKRMFKWAAGEELVPEETYRALALVAGLRKGRTEAHETAPVLPIGDAVVDLTIAKLSPIVADMVRLQRLTGMRPAEVCILRPIDLDRSGDVWLYRPESHKTEHHGRERVVFLGAKARAILLPYLGRERKAYCFCPAEAERQRREVMHASRKTPLGYGNRPGTNRKPRPAVSAGECYTTDSYRRAIHRACDKAEVERWSPNRLRHTAATEVRAKFGLEAAQIVLGHSAADVTQIYTERDLAKGAEVARQIG
jgi:integrase